MTSLIFGDLILLLLLGVTNSKSHYYCGDKGLN